MSKGLSDLKEKYVPDFGYKELIEYKQRKSGWSFLLDIISKYPKREQMINIIKYLNENKEINSGSVDRILNSTSFNLSKEDKNKVIGEIYRMRNVMNTQNTVNIEEEKPEIEKKVIKMKEDLNLIQVSL